MSILINPRHEQFAALIAGGMTPAKAYSAAGFPGRGGAQSASRLAKRPLVGARIAELCHDLSSLAVQRAVVDREYVLRRLRENVERAMQVEPVLDSKGKPVGTYRYDGSVANRALELIGKELGMFREALDVRQKWDGDPSKLTKEQLDKLIEAIEKQVFGDDVAAAAAARETAIRGMKGRIRCNERTRIHHDPPAASTKHIQLPDLFNSHRTP